MLGLNKSFTPRSTTPMSIDADPTNWVFFNLFTAVEDL